MAHTPFPDEADRRAYVSNQVAMALAENMRTLFDQSDIEQLDLIAEKSPLESRPHPLASRSHLAARALTSSSPSVSPCAFRTRSSWSRPRLRSRLRISAR